MAAEQKVDLARRAGDGRGGVVSKPDVIEHARGCARPRAGGRARDALRPPPLRRPPRRSRPDPPDGVRETREKMTTRRKRIAENLLLSQHNTAHLTTFNEIDMSAVSALRERMKEKVEKEHGVKLSFMPFFVKAASMALKAYPARQRLDRRRFHRLHTLREHGHRRRVAMRGSWCPNVKDADRKGMLDVSRDIAALAKKAREGKLTMEDLTGGTFTITNGGVFGSLISTPIINYPQAGILGLHKTQDRPIAVNGQVVIRPMMYIALSYDHRIIDGQQAVLYLVRVKELMEDPAAMLVD